jgi:hypothetical protein
VVATVFGVLVFVVLLLFAAQVLLGLYTTSVVTAATYDAARIVAGADAGTGASARDHAEAGARRQLGRAGHDMTFAWAVDDDAVRLTVRVKRPTLLPRSLATGVGLGDIVRTVQVRTERAR